MDKYERAATAQGWEETKYRVGGKKDMLFHRPDNGMTWEANSWKELCEDFEIVTN